MQFISDVKQRTLEFMDSNSSTLLTAGGVVGTVATAVLAGRAGYKANHILREANAKKREEFAREEPALVDVPKEMLTRTEKLILVGPHFIPPVVTGSGTIAAIIFANRMSAQKAAALAAAYGLAERNLSEYKEKVQEKLTGPKHKQIDDELAQDRVDRDNTHQNLVVIEGEVLCYDQPTGRYFKSTMETIKQAVNNTNAEILHHDYASASFFYEELELPATTWTDEVGWNTDQLVELSYSTVLADGKPCIAIDFKSLPKPDYVPKHY